MFGEYIVDYFCTGIKDASYASNVNRETFSNEVIPRLYSGTPPLDIEASLAHEVVWGAVEYAESLGFDPHRKFREASRILDPFDTHTHSGAIDFGYQGIPLYIPAPDDNQVGIIRRLIEAVGLGNFYYLPRGNVPEEVAELLRVEQPEETPDSAIWTPELQQRSGDTDTQSGLWVPGQQPEPVIRGQSARAIAHLDARALLTPDRIGAPCTASSSARPTSAAMSCPFRRTCPDR